MSTTVLKQSFIISPLLKGLILSWWEGDYNFRNYEISMTAAFHCNDAPKNNFLYIYNTCEAGLFCLSMTGLVGYLNVKCALFHSAP